MAVELKKVTQLAWRRLVISDAGNEGILYLKEQAPRIIRGEPHNIIMAAGVVEGYNMAIDNIYKMIEVEKNKSIEIENP